MENSKVLVTMKDLMGTKKPVMDEEKIRSIIISASIAASDYATAYNCQDEFRPAIEAEHFAYLMNAILSEIKNQADIHRNTILGIQ